MCSSTAWDPSASLRCAWHGSTARARIYAVNRSGRDARDALALAWGADAVIHPDETPLTREMFEKGGVDKVFMTASPAVMPDTMALMNTGGVMGFIGIGSDELGDRRIAFDMRFFHDQKLQIRASNAVPALYFPACLALCCTDCP